MQKQARFGFFHRQYTVSILSVCGKNRKSVKTSVVFTFCIILKGTRINRCRYSGLSDDLVAGLHRPKTDRPCQLATINTHCHVRGTAQLGDRIYVVCAGYGTVEVFSASDCHWLDRVVVSGLDDPHDLQVKRTTLM